MALRRAAPSGGGVDQRPQRKAAGGGAGGGRGGRAEAAEDEDGDAAAAEPELQQDEQEPEAEEDAGETKTPTAEGGDPVHAHDAESARTEAEKAEHGGADAEPNAGGQRGGARAVQFKNSIARPRRNRRRGHGADPFFSVAIRCYPFKQEPSVSICFRLFPSVFVVSHPHNARV